MEQTKKEEYTVTADEADLGAQVSRIVAESGRELDTGEYALPDFDYHDEMIQIEMLFQSHILSFGYKEYTLENYADRRGFSSWKSREGCADTDEMRAGLNIDGILRSADPSESEVLTYLQYVINVAELSRRCFNKDDAQGYEFDIRNYTQLISRVRDLLRRLHYDYRYVESKEFIFIVPHDPAADAAVPDTPSNPLYGSLTEYRSTSCAGNLARKRELLQEIGRTIENYPDNLKTGNNVLYSRIEFLLNHAHIRYDNKEGAERVERIALMNDGELEDWYDETFRLLLVRILDRENIDRLERVDRLAAECGSSIETVTQEEIARIISGESGEEDETEDDFSLERRPASERRPVSERRPASESRRSAYVYEETDRDLPQVSAPKKHPAVKLIVAVIVADILFMLFLMYYFHII